VAAEGPRHFSLTKNDFPSIFFQTNTQFPDEFLNLIYRITIIVVFFVFLRIFILNIDYAFIFIMIK